MGYYHLVITPAGSMETYVVTIDTSTGTPFYSGISNLDLFPDYPLAIDYLKNKFKSESKLSGDGLIGIAQYENLSTVIIVDKSEIKAELPNGHFIRLIRHTTFLNIPIGPNSNKKSSFEEFQLDNNHYFCDTYDLSRLFPSTHPFYDPDPTFVWNLGLMKPFVALGLRRCCITLLQGAAYTLRTKEFTETYILRRSVVNPGTRYVARGLNDLGMPGNEIECELIFIRDNQFWTSSWRRGSPPIRWTTTINNIFSAPKHKASEQFSEGTPEYFQSLKERYGDISIKCVSLLHKGQSERDIYDKYEEAVRNLEKEGVKDVFYIQFDLNVQLHDEGINETLSDFTCHMKPPFILDGFTHGTLPNNVDSRQKGLNRFNCADSLDRTNLATFFFAMMVSSVWCSEQGIGLRKETPLTPINNDLPNTILEQYIVDFLAKAFVESGNSVSFLYTNTPAIKTEGIKKFAPKVISASNDTIMSVNRRMKNVIGDPQRQKIIELWTNPPPLKWFIRLSPDHIFPFPSYLISENSSTSNNSNNSNTSNSNNAKNSEEKNESELLGRYLISPYNGLYHLNRTNEVDYMFPIPMSLFSIIMFLSPNKKERTPRKLIVEGGMTFKTTKIGEITIPSVEAPTRCRWKLGRPEIWGLDHPDILYIRFLRLIFVPYENIDVGNIKIEAQAIAEPMDNPQTIFCVKTQEEDNVERFKESFDQLLKPTMTFADVLQLEQVRLTLSINRKTFREIIVKNGANPWYVDSLSRISNANPNACIQCGNESASPYYQKSFSNPSLITFSKNTKSDQKQSNPNDVKRSSSGNVKPNISNIPTLNSSPLILSSSAAVIKINSIDIDDDNNSENANISSDNNDINVDNNNNNINADNNNDINADNNNNNNADNNNNSADNNNNNNANPDNDNNVNTNNNNVDSIINNTNNNGNPDNDNNNSTKNNNDKNNRQKIDERPSYIMACKNCAITRLSSIAIASDSSSFSSRKFFPTPYFYTNSFIPSQRDRQSIVSMSNSSFTILPSYIYENPQDTNDLISRFNSLLSIKPIPVRLPPGRHHFQLLIYHECMPTMLLIESDPPANVYVQGELLDNEGILPMIDDNNTRVLDFEIDNENETILKGIKVVGLFYPETEQFKPDPKYVVNNQQYNLINNNNNSTYKILFLQSQWDPKLRTSTFILGMKAKVIGVVVEMKDTQYSIIIGLYNGKEYSDSQEIILPEPKGKYIYYFDRELIGNTAKIFYTDRSCNINEPHTVKFICS